LEYVLSLHFNKPNWTAFAGNNVTIAPEGTPMATRYNEQWHYWGSSAMRSQVEVQAQQQSMSALEAHNAAEAEAAVEAMIDEQQQQRDSDVPSPHDVLARPVRFFALCKSPGAHVFAAEPAGAHFRFPRHWSDLTVGLDVRLS
jgi:hypothetical protein